MLHPYPIFPLTGYLRGGIKAPEEAAHETMDVGSLSQF